MSHSEEIAEFNLFLSSVTSQYPSGFQMFSGGIEM